MKNGEALKTKKTVSFLEGLEAFKIKLNLPRARKYLAEFNAHF